MAYDKNNIFARILRGEIPCKKVYEDPHVLAFHDINPMAPVHFMLIPKTHVASLEACAPEHQAVLGKILLLAPRLARENGTPEGFRTIINTGRIARQEVYHLHVHIAGGPAPLGRMLPR